MYRERLQSQSLPNLGNKGDGGSSSKSKNTGAKTADTGGVQNGDGGNGNGDGGSVAPEVKKDTTDTTKQTLPPDKDLEALFQASDAYLAFDKKYENASAEKYDIEYQKALSKWIEKNAPEAPGSSEPEKPLDVFRRTPSVAKTEEEIFLDITRVNPHYQDPDFNIVQGPDTSVRRNIKHRINCQRCVVANEARRKGYDVNAVSVEEGYLAVPWDNSLNDGYGQHDFDNYSATNNDIASLFELEDGSNPSWEWVPSVTRTGAISQLEAKILAWGEGARGIVYAAWMKKYNGGAHVFSVEVKDGKILYLDPQSGKANYGSGLDPNFNWKMRFSPSKSLGAMRVDNADINANGVTWMKERNNFQVNLPTGAELTAHIDGKTPQEQIIWGHIWQQIRAGDAPSLPPELASEPEAMKTAKEAAAWVRRPD